MHLPKEVRVKVNSVLTQLWYRIETARILPSSELSYFLYIYTMLLKTRVYVFLHSQQSVWKNYYQLGKPLNDQAINYCINSIYDVWFGKILSMRILYNGLEPGQECK